MVGFLTPLISLATTWFDGFQEKQKAKTKVEVSKAEAEAQVYLSKATHENEWDLQAMRNAETSWKDEFLLILFAIPFVMAFIPQTQPYVVAGFEILQDLPEWYQYSLGVMVAASFGVRKFMKVIGK